MKDVADSQESDGLKPLDDGDLIPEAAEPIPYSVLGRHLAPVADLLKRPDISEIVVNEPGVVWFERAGQAHMERRDQPEYTGDKMMRLANAVASASGQRISGTAPLLSAQIPDVGRMQLVKAPAVENGVAMAIRRATQKAFSLQDYRDNFANALLGEVAPMDRIITIEDTRELLPPQGNHLALIASRGGQSRAKVDAVTLLEASLRLRPDRIILGELRGVEAYPFIRAINTGHPGAITTIHADTPGGALDQIAFLVLQYGLSLDLDRVREYVARQIDVIIQLGRRNGERRVEKVFYRHAKSEL